MVTTESTDKNVRDYMTNTQENALSARSGDALDSGSTLCGVDTKDRIHMIDRTHGAGVAIFDSAADTDPLVITPDELEYVKTPGAWAQHISKTTGWQYCRVAGYGADQ